MFIVNYYHWHLITFYSVSVDSKNRQRKWVSTSRISFKVNWFPLLSQQNFCKTAKEKNVSIVKYVRFWHFHKYFTDIPLFEFLKRFRNSKFCSFAQKFVEKVIENVCTKAPENKQLWSNFKYNSFDSWNLKKNSTKLTRKVEILKSLNSS